MIAGVSYVPKISVICFTGSKIYITCNDNVAGNIMDNGLLTPEQVCYICALSYITNMQLCLMVIY